MLQAAAYGAQALDSATKRSVCDMAPRPQPPPPLPTNGERLHEEGDGGAGKARQTNVNVSDWLSSRRHIANLVYPTLFFSPDALSQIENRRSGGGRPDVPRLRRDLYTRMAKRTFGYVPVEIIRN